MRVAGRGLAVRPDGEGWTAFQFAVAAELTIEGAVASHETAGVLHGFPLHSGSRSGGPAHVITTRPHKPVRNIAVHRLRLEEWEVQAHGGVRLTSPERTAVDLCASLPMERALDLWAWVSPRKILDLDELRATLDERRGWHGSAQLKTLLTVVAGGAVSGAEFRLHSLLDEAGLGGWQAGVRVCDGEGVIGVVDLLFAAARLVIEVDGWRAHSSRRSFVEDRRRQNRLIAAGFRVLRFTWDDLTQHPARVLAEITRLTSGRST